MRTTMKRILSAAALVAASVGWAVPSWGEEEIVLQAAAAPASPEYLSWLSKQKKSEDNFANPAKTASVSVASRTSNEKSATGVFLPPSRSGAIPSSIDFCYLTNFTRKASIKGRVRNLANQNQLSSRYDPRDGHAFTPIRHQDPNDQGVGTCWAQATVGSMETYLVLQKNISTQFSVRNMVNGTRYNVSEENILSKDYSPWMGAHWTDSAAYLLRWSGPVLESQDSYTDKNGAVNLSFSSLTFSPQYHLQGTRVIPKRTSSTDNAALKKAIVEFGGVWAIMRLGGYDESKYSMNHYMWNVSKGAYHLPTAKIGSTYHAVTVIGWDDDFPATNFCQDWESAKSLMSDEEYEKFDGDNLTSPPGNGAFIVRDSYGNEPGRLNGYFYVSYYDAVFARADAGCAFSFLESTDNYDRVYEYDDYGWMNSINITYTKSGVSSTAYALYAANLFTAEKDENLSAVGFYATVPGMPYTISIYTGCTADSPSSGTKVLTQSGTVGDYAGYYTIPLSAVQKLTKDQRFAVVMHLDGSSASSADGQNHDPLPIEYHKVSDGDKVASATGQSFVSLNGTSWTDMIKFSFTDYDRRGDKTTCQNVNFCCKAYTTDIKQAAPVIKDSAGANAENVSLEWDAVTGATSYSVYRSTSSTKPSGAIKTGLTGTSYQDTTGDAGVEYYYWVSAVGANGEGVSAPVQRYRAVSLSVASGTKNFGQAADSGSVKVTANAGWTATKETDKSWLTLTQSSGTTGESVQFSVTANPDSAERQCVITVTAAAGTAHSVTKEITVTQSGPTVSSIAISGDAEVWSGGQKQYTCTATYSNKSTGPVTPTWQATAGTISAQGVFTAPEVVADTAVTISATYGDVSADPFTVRVKARPVTTAPTNPTAVQAADGKSITLNWTAPAATMNYCIYRNTEDEMPDEAYTNVSNVATFVDKNVTIGQTYHYWIVAQNPAGEYLPSAAVPFTAVAVSVKLAAPTGLTATATDNGTKIRLDWQYANVDDITFQIFRWDSELKSWFFWGLASRTTTYTDSSVADGKTYSYYLVATSSKAGYSESDKSAEVSLTAHRLKPNLVLEKWDSSWVGPVFLSRGNMSVATNRFYVGTESIMRCLGYRNNGDADAGTFKICEQVLTSTGDSVAGYSAVTSTISGLSVSLSKASIKAITTDWLDGLPVGSYKYRVTIDCEGAIAESDETDNVAEYDFEIVAIPELPDLNFNYVPDGWPQAVFLSDGVSKKTKVSEFAAEDAVYLFMAMNNGGSVRTPVGMDVLHEVIDDNEHVVASCAETIDNYLNPQEYGWFVGLQLEILQNLSPGSYTYRCTLDQDKKIAEIYEDNNVAEFSFVVNARPDTPASDFQYEETSDGVVITRYTGTDTAVVVPATIGSETVVGIGKDAFYNKADMTYLKIPEGVLSIGVQACCYCSNLVSVVIPSTVTNIGQYAFYNCRNLLSVELPDGITSIEYATFCGCFSLPEIHIPESVTTIGEYAFQNCNWLTVIEIPEGVTTIGKQAFCYCRHLAEAVIPSTVTSVGRFAFYGCALDAICLSNRVFELSGNHDWTVSTDDSHSGGCYMVSEGLAANESAIMSTTVDGAGTLTFWYKFNTGDDGSFEVQTSNGSTTYSGYSGNWVKKTITITEEGLQTITWTLNGNSSASSFVKIDGVTWEPAPSTLGFRYEVIDGKAKITRYVGTDADVTVPNSLDGYTVAEIGENAFSEKPTVARVTIPSTVTNIGNYAFFWCGALQSVEIPSSVTVLGEYAFGGCSNLTSVALPPNVTSIGDGTFVECRSLATLEIPAGVTNIGYAAFAECSGLTALSIPAGVTYIGPLAFKSCTGLETFVVDGANTHYKITDGVLYTKDGTTLVCCPGGVSGMFTVPSGVETVVEMAFAGCGEMTSVAIPSSVTSVECYAFDGCDSLATVYVEEGDADRVRGLLEDSCLDCEGIAFVEQSEPIPELPDNPTQQDIATALAGSQDERLAEHIVDAASYNAYREWAGTVKTADGTGTAGREAVKGSAHAWLSFALASDRLVAKEPAEGDLQVDGFEPTSESGKFDFTVSVKDIAVGSEATAENLKKVFGLEGGTTADPSGFSSDNVDITFGTPSDGKVKFTAGPKDSTTPSFFMKVKMAE